MIFNKSWFYTLTPKFLWYILDIQGSGFVKLHDIWMCIFVFYKWAYAAKMSSEQHVLHLTLRI